MITKDSIQSLLQTTHIVDVIGDFLTLKRRGANYLANCPFHGERTPSFTVSPAKEIYKCFGCGKSGNAVTFLMEHEKLTYVEALRWLAQKYNITLEEEAVSEAVKSLQSTAESLAAVMAFAKKWYADNLWHQKNNLGLAYLEHRNFNVETLKKFSIGWASEAPNELAQALQKNQFRMEFAIKCGLVSQKENRYFDTYRNRIIFPIHNPLGKVIAFGARLITEHTNAPKYINSPENELYSKGKILYDFTLAKAAIIEKKSCILVEGYTDVLRLYESGFKNVLASAGTALTTEQIRLIKKFSSRLLLLYDADEAGRKATLRAIPLALEAGLQLSCCILPDKQDPDSFLQKEGTEAFTNNLENNTKDFIDFQLTPENLALVNKDIEAKNTRVQELAEQIACIYHPEDFAKQNHYIQKAADILQIPIAPFKALISQLSKDKLLKKSTTDIPSDTPSQTYPTPLPETQRKITNWDTIEEHILRILIFYGNLLLPEYDNQPLQHLIIPLLQEKDFFKNPIAQKIIALYLEEKEKTAQAPNAQFFLQQNDKEIIDFIINLDILAHHPLTREDLMQSDMRSVLDYMKLRKLQLMRKEKIQELGTCQNKTPNNENEMKELFFIISEIDKEIKNLGEKIGLSTL